MTKLVTCIGLGKGTWSQVIPLIDNENWDKVVVITNEFGSEKFSAGKEVERVIVNTDLPLGELEKEIRAQLREHIGLGDVGVNLISGTGKEHMAILSSLLKLGVGIRLVSWDGEKVCSH